MLAFPDVVPSCTKSDPIDWFEFMSQSRPNLSCPSDGARYWRLKGFLHNMDEDGKVLGDDLCVARAFGFSIQPGVVAEKTGYGIFEVYDAPSQSTVDAFFTYFSTKTEGLTSRVARLVGIDRQTRTDFAQNVPDLHVHIKGIDFTAGFESAYDVMQVLDEVISHFMPSQFTPWVLITIDATAFNCPVHGTRPEEKRLKAITKVLKECGFAAMGESWVYRSGNADHSHEHRRRLGMERPDQLDRRPL